MKLECLMLWAERFLFTGQDGTEKGLIGWLKGSFTEDDRIVFTEMSGEADNRFRNEWEELCIFLSGEHAEYMLRTLADLNAFCRDKFHDHIPYSFNRECWGFRVLTEAFAWYIALTPWNVKRQVTIYCYHRTILMTNLAAEKGLPEYCYGVLKYTGERILIHYGEDMYESFPQYGGNMADNRRFADEQNQALNLSAEQVSAMENGVIYGWDTPAADPGNYDENGHFYVPVEEPRERRR